MMKKELREIYLQKRLSFSDAQYDGLNRQLCENFFAGIDLSSIRVLHTFLPIKKNREPDTWLIIERIQSEFPDVSIAVPKINNETAQLDNFYFEGPHQLTENVWGIPEPKQGIPVPTEKVDAVLVPLLAFDKKGNRVGYGRGFYDKFMATCRTDCKKIGLSFFGAVDSIDNIHSYDLPLDIVITPEEVLMVING